MTVAAAVRAGATGDDAVVIFGAMVLAVLAGVADWCSVPRLAPPFIEGSVLTGCSAGERTKAAAISWEKPPGDTGPDAESSLPPRRTAEPAFPLPADSVEATTGRAVVMIGWVPDYVQ